MFGRIWEKKQQHLTKKKLKMMEGASFWLDWREVKKGTQKGIGCGSELMLIASRSFSKNKHTFLEGKN